MSTRLKYNIIILYIDFSHTSIDTSILFDDDVVVRVYAVSYVVVACVHAVFFFEIVAQIQL